MARQRLAQALKGEHGVRQRCTPAAGLLWLGLAALVAFGPAAAQPQDRAALQAEIEQAARDAGGTVGVGIRHLGTGEELYLNRSARFPMGSLFKVPVAVELLARASAGAVSLDKAIEIGPGDLRPGSGRLAKGFPGSREMSLRELLETMLIDSDNTATDLVWKEVGGAPAVMARLDTLGLKGITVARPSGTLLAAAIGLEHQAGNTEVTPTFLDELTRRIPRRQRTGEIAAFLRDERDTTTPEAYVALLARIWRGEALDAPHTSLLLDIMRRCATGRWRLRAGLPAGTRLAHKTGTLTPVALNDAGIVTLPTGAHVVVAVLVRESPLEPAAKERAIAAVARAVYRHFAPQGGART